MPKGTDRGELVKAAGGIVWRDASRRELAVIYRDRYVPDECCLPKGKLDAGEGWEQAAIREVLEETGCDAEIVGFAGLLHYQVGKGPKVVVYFDMLAVSEEGFVPSPEVTKMAWLAPPQALEELAHDGEREMLGEFLARR